MALFTVVQRDPVLITESAKFAFESETAEWVLLYFFIWNGIQVETHSMLYNVTQWKKARGGRQRKIDKLTTKTEREINFIMKMCINLSGSIVACESVTFVVLYHFYIFHLYPISATTIHWIGDTLDRSGYRTLRSLSMTTTNVWNIRIIMVKQADKQATAWKWNQKWLSYDSVTASNRVPSVWLSHYYRPTHTTGIIDYC